MNFSREIAETVLGARLVDGKYGIRTLKSEKDLWSSFWNLVNAAGKVAKAEWLLHKAGRPHTTGGHIFDTREVTPKAGFHLCLTKEAWDGGEDKDQYYTHKTGMGFHANENGLKRALKAVESAKDDESVIEITLEVSWRHFLPGDVDNYCAPLFHWVHPEFKPEVKETFKDAEVPFEKILRKQAVL